MFGCLFLKKKKIIKIIDNRPIYNNNKDSYYTLNKRIENGLNPNENDIKYLKDNENFINTNELEQCYRNILYNKLYIEINYKKEKKDIIDNIDTMRNKLCYKLKNNMLPVFFQTSRNLETSEKLKDIIFNTIHLDNVILLIDLF